MQVQKQLTIESTPSSNPDPSHIMQIGTGFWASKVLLSAVKLGLFTFLGNGAYSAADIR